MPGNWFALEKGLATLASYFAGIPAGIFARPWQLVRGWEEQLVSTFHSRRLAQWLY